MKKCQYAVVALCQAPYLLDDPNVGMIFPRANHYPFFICKLISAYSDSRGLLGARKASSSLLFVIFISQRGNALFQEVLVYATILLLTLLLWLFAPPNFLIRLELLLIDERLHWSEPCMALRMSFEASLFREPHHFSTKNKDIHRFTDHQFTISFSHNSVLSINGSRIRPLNENMKKCQYALSVVVALCQAPYLLEGMVFPRAKHYLFLICKLISAYSDSRGLLEARKASSSLLSVIFISQLHWSEPCMALRMSSEASLFREPHHFSTKNKDIHRFTDHQFTISFSHNSVLSAANCLRDMECQEEVDVPKAFVNPGGDFGIVPAQLVLMSKDHNIHCFSAAILRRAGECKCDQEASPEKAIHHNLTDLSFLPCPCGFVYVSSPLFRSTKTMDVATTVSFPKQVCEDK
ncbi:hypothetical protein F2Q69_00041476 [Brassica cretica]|uniref:Uncharacterized protein n=1 Tax=Brassica cretica TaxID=69181 RepID=A0A8S9NRF3_BRACR|nr:hypothetical protein F2Q69_00041476 [Brassica cretica]